MISRLDKHVCGVVRHVLCTASNILWSLIQPRNPDRGEMGWDLCCRWSHRISFYFIAWHHITLYHTTLFRSISTLYMYTKISQVSKSSSIKYMLVVPVPLIALRAPSAVQHAQHSLLAALDSSQVGLYIGWRIRLDFGISHYITWHHITSRHNTLFQMFYSEDPPCPTPLHLISCFLRYILSPSYSFS